MKELSWHSRFSAENTQIKMIANRVEKEEDGQVLFNKLNAVVARYLKVPFSYLGAVPYDNLLSKAVMQQQPVSLQNPTAKSSLAYEAMAAKLMDREVPVPKRGMAAFFSHIVNGKKKG